MPVRLQEHQHHLCGIKPIYCLFQFPGTHPHRYLTNTGNFIFTFHGIFFFFVLCCVVFHHLFICCFQFFKTFSKLFVFKPQGGRGGGGRNGSLCPTFFSSSKSFTFSFRFFCFHYQTVTNSYIISKLCL